MSAIDRRLSGKTAIITGAAHGIGRATATLFADEGARVIAVDVDSDGLADLADECECQTCQIDLTDRTSLDAFVQSVTQIDILFLCAGYVATGTILDCEEDDWERSFAVNVTPMYRIVRAILPAMIERGQGSIITMSSVASSIRGVPDRFVYSTTKAAVIGLTKAIAADFVGSGIRCNAICPGTVDTPSLDRRARATSDYEATRAAFISRQPMGRLGSPLEIGRLALYLASDESSFVTGQCHIADGGWSN